jgi:succinate dehydrogenase/fumarate reductase flavoprotein subunit
MTDNSAARWPYPVHYGLEKEISTDILIIGGGIAGCHAAITAARRGARVAVLDKVSMKTSGGGGSGVDHWHAACTNPCSRVSPDEMVQVVEKYDYGLAGEYGMGITCYILCRESYDTLLDMEKMGAKIRDVDDEFVGAEFRDEKTKLMFAYDYVNRHNIRVFGANFKDILYREMKRLGVQVYDRVMATSLLTEEGKQGGRVIGATGLNTRTGEFYIFNSKATIMCTAMPLRLWVFSTEIQGLASVHDDPNCSGDGHAMAWNAGAKFTLMERSIPQSGQFRYPSYGTGNASNTWFACTIVDSNGKEIPWVDKDGRMLRTVSERYCPAPGQRFILANTVPPPQEYRGPSLIPDLAERIKKGEYVLPFYADLPGMSEKERRALFGLMVGNEGRTRIPIYQVYTEAGFDPDRDMLQANVLPPDAYTRSGAWWGGIPVPQLREPGFVNGGGMVFDWDLKSSLEGLYVAGTSLAGGSDHAAAACTGRYAARKAVEYSRNAGKRAVSKEQVEKEKSRVYAPVERKSGVSWKTLQAGLCRVMQDYCGEYKSGETLQIGLKWLASIRESEAAEVQARNPHELMRVLECLTRLTVGEMVMQASLARQASAPVLSFNRIDFPQNDPPEWKKYITTWLESGEVKVGDLPLYYWRLPPNASTYRENYDQHCGL